MPACECAGSAPRDLVAQSRAGRDVRLRIVLRPGGVGHRGLVRRSRTATVYLTTPPLLARDRLDRAGGSADAGTGSGRWISIPTPEIAAGMLRRGSLACREAPRRGSTIADIGTPISSSISARTCASASCPRASARAESHTVPVWGGGLAGRSETRRAVARDWRRIARAARRRAKCGGDVLRQRGRRARVRRRSSTRCDSMRDDATCISCS